MTKFMINKKTHALKTDVNLLMGEQVREKKKTEQGGEGGGVEGMEGQGGNDGEKANIFEKYLQMN